MVALERINVHETVGRKNNRKLNFFSMYFVRNNEERYLSFKNSEKLQTQALIKKREKVGINHYDDPKAFIEYSNDVRDVYKNIVEYNPDKDRKILIIFDDMIADMVNNKKLNSIVTDLFIRGRKLNISLVFITQSYFKFPKDARPNSTHFSLWKFQKNGNFNKLH